MEPVYLASLIGGALAVVLFSALSLLGSVHHGAAHSAHNTGSIHGHSAAHHAASHAQVKASSPAGTFIAWTASWLSPLTLAAACLWFGAAGSIGSQVGLPAPLIVIAAVIGAVVGAVLIRTYMSLLVGSSTAPLRSAADGVQGVLNAAIGPNITGEVSYVFDGLTRNIPARSIDGLPLPRSTPVVIVRREKGIAYVAPLDPLASYTPLEASPTSNAGEPPP